MKPIISRILFFLFFIYLNLSHSIPPNKIKEAFREKVIYTIITKTLP